MRNKRSKKFKHLWTVTICGIFLLLGFQKLWAVTLFPKFSQSKDVTIGATVGTFHLSVSGYQSPFASIILKTQSGTFLASTTADSKGYFSISNTLINSSVLTYCFQAVDFKRVGESDACITIAGPIIGDITQNDIFLPPTVGLSKKQINAGEDAVIYGYSMPGATVLLAIEGKVIQVTTGADGYYTYIYKSVPQGVFRISATATLAEKNSLTPTNDVVLEALSVPQRITQTGEKVIQQVKKNVPFDLLPFLLIALAFLTAIGILLYKLRFHLWVIFIDFLRRRKKMHHDWFLDKW